MKLNVLFTVLLLFAATGTAFASNPETTIKKIGFAVADKDSRGFMQLVDLDAMLDAEPAMYGSNALYLGSSGGNKHSLEDRIASGVMALQCKETRRPGCAWTVDGLKKPRVRKTGRHSAVASVDNPQGIRTWIALYQGDHGWKVVGVATRERDAETYASEEFQQKRETYRANRVAQEQAVEARQAEEARAAERRREENRLRAVEEMRADRAILRTITFTNVTITHRTNAGHDGRQHQLAVQGTAVNGYARDVARVRWRLDFLDGNGASTAHITWMDTDMGDTVLRRGASYERKWNLPLNKAALVRAGEQFAKGQCMITIRADMLYVGDTFVSDQNRAY